MKNNPITDAKRRLMLTLAEDKEIFELLGNDDVTYDCYDDLIYNNIFPFEKVDFTETQAGNYIGVGMNFPVIKENDVYKTSQITFLIICNTETLRIGNTTYARTDAIGERITEIMQDSSVIGFPLKLYSDNEGIHSSRFYYRRLIFKSKASNTTGVCG